VFGELMILSGGAGYQGIGSRRRCAGLGTSRAYPPIAEVAFEYLVAGVDLK